jgi:hypothetical protein
MRRWAVATIGIPGLTLALAGATACGLVSGLDDYTIDSSSGTGGSSSSGGGGGGSGGGPGPCMCMDAPPAGWSGPAAFAALAGAPEPPACPAGWSEAQRGGTGVDYVPAECHCACQVNGTCTFDGAVIGAYTDAVCVTLDIENSAIASGCADFVANAIPVAVKASLLTANGVACMAMEDMPTRPPAIWQSSAHLCAPPPGEACPNEQVCVPQPSSDHQLCIFQQGDALCPNGYDIRHVFDSVFSDNRTCTSCTCGSGQCEGSTALYSDTMCNGKVVDVPHAEICTAYPQQVMPIRYQHGAATPTCPATSTPLGEVTSEGPITVCCPAG